MEAASFSFFFALSKEFKSETIKSAILQLLLCCTSQTLRTSTSDNKQVIHSRCCTKPLVPLSAIRILVTPPACLIFSSLSGYHRVLFPRALILLTNAETYLHTVTFLSPHQSLISPLCQPFVCALLRPAPAGYRCAELL